jgi:ABC-type nitrate/sulfonate/bicarbonate transport system permease component
MKRLSHFVEENRVFLIGLLSVSLFLVIWEILPSYGLIDPFFSSSPSRIVSTAIEMFVDGFWHDIQISFLEFFWGMLIAVVVGIGLGLLLGWYGTLYAILEPFLTMLNAAPRVALIPLLILWLGIGLQSKIAAVVLGAFFPLAISVMKSVQTLDDALLQCAKSFGANDTQVFRTLILPNSVPFIMAGLHIAIGRGLVGVVIGELLASQAGVGHVMAIASSTFQTDKLYVALFVLTGFGYGLTKLVEIFEKRLNVWRS